jgi:NADPH:quinone reductase-like Zn-dependent oxidoreductase
MRHMRIIVTHYGGPDALQVVEEERPEPKGGEVRVRVLAAGVSLPDLMMRDGVHPETPPVPFTPGWDLVGVVDRVGDGVSGIEVSQIVAALPISGAYAEFVCLPQRELVPVPSGLDPAEAVSLDSFTYKTPLHFMGNPLLHQLPVHRSKRRLGMLLHRSL